MSERKAAVSLSSQYEVTEKGKWALLCGVSIMLLIGIDSIAFTEPSEQSMFHIFKLGWAAILFGVCVGAVAPMWQKATPRPNETEQEMALYRNFVLGSPLVYFVLSAHIVFSVFLAFAEHLVSPEFVSQTKDLSFVALMFICGLYMAKMEFLWQRKSSQ